MVPQVPFFLQGYRTLVRIFEPDLTTGCGDGFVLRRDGLVIGYSFSALLENAQGPLSGPGLGRFSFKSVSKCYQYGSLDFARAAS